MSDSETITAPAVLPADVSEVDVPRFVNLLDLGDRWLLKQHVPDVQLRTLVGREIVGIAAHPANDGRMVPVYDIDRTGWLDKWFAFVVPKREGVFDLSARCFDEKHGVNRIKSQQVIVTKGDDGKFSIKRLGYGAMVEHFGGTRLTRGEDGALRPASTEVVPESLASE